MPGLAVERIVHFDVGREFVKGGFVHFGFHDRKGNHYAISHRGHYLGLVGSDDSLKWTVAGHQVIEGVPNIKAELNFPIYIDGFDDGRLVVSNFGDSRLYLVDPASMRAELFFDGSKVKMRSAGNCVVDGEENVWLNEVEGCKVWKLDRRGRPLMTLGTGDAGFQRGSVGFDEARFSWIYDIRRGPEGAIYVLDSRNYAVRVIDPFRMKVETMAGTGKPGYGGDGMDAKKATFGGDPSARFDGPISLSLDREGNVYVGDRFNHVVRMIERGGDQISTVAGDSGYSGLEPNDDAERNPLALRLPKISSMDYHDGLLMVPTDLTDQTGDLVVLRRQAPVAERL